MTIMKVNISYFDSLMSLIEVITSHFCSLMTLIKVIISYLLPVGGRGWLQTQSKHHLRMDEVISKESIIS